MFRKWIKVGTSGQIGSFELGNDGSITLHGLTFSPPHGQVNMNINDTAFYNSRLNRRHFKLKSQEGTERAKFDGTDWWYSGAYV